MKRALVLAMVGLVACKQSRIEVSKDQTADYNHGAFLAAVDKFVAAGRTAPAYAELAKTVLALRPGMDRATCEEAELKMMVLALAPMQAVADKPIDQQIDTLALTVWPLIMSAEIEPDEILRKRDLKADRMPEPKETPHAYIERLCGKTLAGDCKHVVPELQGNIVAALAIRRATERVRIAVADCVMCSADPGWANAVKSWEALDHAANATIHEVELRGDPDNWPMAGEASQKDPGLPEAEINHAGEVVVGGEAHGAMTRVDALRDLRFMHGESSPIALHVRPDMTIDQVKGVLADTRKSGAKKIAVVARDTSYPWERRVYWLSDTQGIGVKVRPSDTLQLLLHAIDHIAPGPDTVVRVE